MGLMLLFCGRAVHLCWSVCLGYCVDHGCCIWVWSLLYCWPWDGEVLILTGLCWPLSLLCWPAKLKKMRILCLCKETSGEKSRFTRYLFTNMQSVCLCIKVLITWWETIAFCVSSGLLQIHGEGTDSSSASFSYTLCERARSWRTEGGIPGWQQRLDRKSVV